MKTVTTFLKHEDLIAVDVPGVFEAYHTRKEQLNMVASGKTIDSKPVAVLPSRSMGSGGGNEFIGCHENGAVNVLEYRTY